MQQVMHYSAASTGSTHVQSSEISIQAGLLKEGSQKAVGLSLT
jgi:hypothetical protein